MGRSRGRNPKKTSPSDSPSTSSGVNVSGTNNGGSVSRSRADRGSSCVSTPNEPPPNCRNSVRANKGQLVQPSTGRTRNSFGINAKSGGQSMNVSGIDIGISQKPNSGKPAKNNINLNHNGGQASNGQKDVSHFNELSSDDDVDNGKTLELRNSVPPAQKDGRVSAQHSSNKKSRSEENLDMVNDKTGDESEPESEPQYYDFDDDLEDEDNSYELDQIPFDNWPEACDWLFSKVKILEAKVNQMESNVNSKSNNSINPEELEFIGNEANRLAVPKSWFESSVSRPGDAEFKKGFMFLLSLIFSKDFFTYKTISNLTPEERQQIEDVLDIYFDYLVAAKKLNRLQVSGCKTAVNRAFIRKLQNDKASEEERLAKEEKTIPQFPIFSYKRKMKNKK